VTAVRCAAAITFSLTSVDRARTNDTLFGAANVRSNPCTDFATNALPAPPLGVTPSSSHRATTAVSAAPPAAAPMSKPADAETKSASPMSSQVGTRVSLSV